ncbi:conserved hypothetical protein [delta proteobacterium NaphS2]|nr:conserved hypothetical protein [delta proteobacterium NaphS2]
MKKISLGIIGLIILFSPSGGNAAYLIELKDGSQITASGYREEGDEFKIERFGGVIGIKKDRVISIEEIEDRPQEIIRSHDEKANSPETDAIKKHETAHGPLNEKADQENATKKEEESPAKKNSNTTKQKTDRKTDKTAAAGEDDSKNGLNREEVVDKKREILAQKEFVKLAFKEAKRTGDKKEIDKQWKTLSLLEQELAEMRKKVRAVNGGRLPSWWKEVE